MSKVLKRHFNLAKKLASKSDHHSYRLGCVIFKGSKVLSLGYNQIKTHTQSPHDWKMIHAEFHALLGVAVCDLRGASACVYRESRSGRVGLAKPCKGCESLLFGAGLRKVYFTTDTGYDSYTL